MDKASVVLREWWDIHGFTVAFSKEESKKRRVVIKNNVARLTIEKRMAWNDWVIKWSIIHVHNEDYISGQVTLEPNELIVAFDLLDNLSRNKEILSDYKGSFVRKYKATVAREGHFLRYEELLNIPGPKTMSKGDPNISICLNNEIKNAISKLY